MEGYWEIDLGTDVPVIAASIHQGHDLPMDLMEHMALNGDERLREEDPFTDRLADIQGNRISVRLSRFASDFNRPESDSVYLTPEQAWGLQVWKSPPEGSLLNSLYGYHAAFYAELHDALDGFVEKHGSCLVLDVHSYNHRRGGPNAPPADKLENPVVNLGTGTVLTDRWRELTDRFLADLGSCTVGGKLLDVRENVKFKGGFFPRWIHRTFRDSVCVLSVEFKKTFMDEWTGIADPGQLVESNQALVACLPGIVENLETLRRL